MATPQSKPDLGKPQFASHAWLEPVIVVSLMIGSLILNRRKDYSIFGKAQPLIREPLLHGDREVEDNERTPESDPLRPSKRRNCCGTVIKTPNSSRFADNFHSRVLQKYPFLIEMFYWALNYLAYSVTKSIAARLIPSDDSVTLIAQNHGIAILDFEHESVFRRFFFIQESDFQNFFISGHQTVLTLLNRIYSLVHIPGTVAFLSWYYYAAPNHATFAVARRTMTLGNFAAFIVFCFYPCMPPRLLPASYHFYDTVRQDHAESIWVGGNNINQFAAMPSLHFTYALVVGCTFLYHSGLIDAVRGRKRSSGPRRSTWGAAVFLVLGICYPLLVLTVIVATANHYWLDAVVAIFTVSASFICNRVWIVLLPAEDLLLWALRLEKPVPSTGSRAAHEGTSSSPA